MKEQIVNLLRKQPNLMPAAIAQQLNASPASVRKALTLLRRQKKVTRRANCTYILWEPAPESVVVSRESLSGVA